MVLISPSSTMDPFTKDLDLWLLPEAPPGTLSPPLELAPRATSTKPLSILPPEDLMWGWDSLPSPGDLFSSSDSTISLEDPPGESLYPPTSPIWVPTNASPASPTPEAAQPQGDPPGESHSPPTSPIGVPADASPASPSSEVGQPQGDPPGTPLGFPTFVWKNFACFWGNQETSALPRDHPEHHCNDLGCPRCWGPYCVAKFGKEGPVHPSLTPGLAPGVEVDPLSLDHPSSVPFVDPFTIYKGCNKMLKDRFFHPANLCLRSLGPGHAFKNCKQCEALIIESHGTSPIFFFFFPDVQ